MQSLPLYISMVLIAATLFAIVLFYKATRFSKTTLLILIGWLLLQGSLALTGFYTITNALPPRFLLLLLLPVVCIILLFTTRAGKRYLDNLDLKTLSLLHLVRVPIEVVLFWLALHKAIPQLMTFEGHNFDIFSGLTAPFVYYFGFQRKMIGRRLLLFWNFLCLGLLINVVAIGILSAPSLFQQLAFDQPNIAILYFPFVWLPCCIVPLVALAHLASIRKLLLKKATVTQEDSKAMVTTVALH